MSPDSLESVLRDLPRVGSLIKDRGYRQVWRFELEGHGYYLKFYPRVAGRLKRLFRGNPALLEFTRLQLLQKASVPAPRAVAHLVGLKINDQTGDAVILEGIEPAVALDQYVCDYQLRGEPIPNHADLARQIRHLLQQLGRAKLGHNDLHLGNFLLKDGKLYLLDAYAVRSGGLTLDHAMHLAHSVRSIASRADLQRGWEQLGSGGPAPTYNAISQRQWRKLLERTHGENAYFGKLTIDGWRGYFFKHYKYPRRWAPASRLNVSAADWNRELPRLWQQLQSDQLTAIKKSPSGDVFSGEIVLGGKPIDIIIKRPYKRYWYRYINEIGRGSRSWRAWNKAWNLIVRDLPTAWPLAVFQKRSAGYIVDSLIIFEKIPGPTLASVDLDAMQPAARENLFWRTGGILRKIESHGYSHFDAKSSNWIVQDDERLGPRPILIDVDGVRHRRWIALGIERLLRSMRQHQQYSPADSYALCMGYAPFSGSILEQEEDEVEAASDQEENETIATREKIDDSQQS